MQQQMAQQHDQMGMQQAMSQQMVLCPVRFVYETQILVQPGDQIQPNQTFFINPQNPPPWMHNSLQPRQAISNPPVVYVQQLPNNLVSSVQQPMDQNQLYLQQNFANYQLQQQMLAQNSQEARPTMQIANIVPNMVQNQIIQTSAPNERALNQNPQIIQNQMQRPVQNQMVNQAVEVQRQVYMRPQMPQQTHIQRPMMSMNQMPHMQQQTLVNMPNVGPPAQTYVPNNMVPVRPQPSMRTSIANNVVNVQPVPKIRELPPTETTKPVSSPIGNVVPTVRNFVPNNYYRPIQPRPQVANNMPKVQHIPVQTIQNTPTYNIDKPTQQQQQQTPNNNFAIIQQLNNPINRKRKSESPDDTQKTATIAVVKQIYPTQHASVSKIVNEIGTNTSPIHRAKVKPQVAASTTLKIIGNKDLSKELAEKDKLIRNTVYPQARGRVLQDKVDETKPLIETKTVEVVEQPKPNVVEEKIIKPNTNIVPVKRFEGNIIKTEPQPIKPIMEVKCEKVEPPENVQIENPTAEQTVNVTNDKTVETVDNNEVDTVNDNKKENVEEGNVKESNRLSIKQENINILTHVVDGYVIQESNFAFPIRKPLKEKTLHINKKPKENEKRDLVRESIKEELKNNNDTPLLPFHYLLLDSAREEKERAEAKEAKEVKEVAVVEEEKEEENENPFGRVQHSMVKSWTIDDLSTYLMKFSWKETVSLLQEHEIDGETLYLVSKPQLLTIGVAEEHADIICEFVKS